MKKVLTKKGLVVYHQDPPVTMRFTHKETEKLLGKKIGFIIVSNSFKSNFDNFINEVTWTTDIKRFILLTSEALLYLLAYKTKDQFNISRKTSRSFNILR